MAPICFIDGARFDGVAGFLAALQHGVLAVPEEDEAFALLVYLFHPRRAPCPDRPRLHVVWLNSEVSRRRLAGGVERATRDAPLDGAGRRPVRRRFRGSFSELAQSLAAFPGIDLILL
jgi:hypothetical protein